MTERRVDDLARAAGTTVRNVRLYQERGLLPPPRRAGRVGWYDDRHLARLRLITKLLERGYSLANIAELLSTWESGRDLSAVLGLEQVLTSPWTDEHPVTTTLTELRKVFGAEFGDAQAARLVELGLLREQGRRYLLPSPALLGVAGDLVAAGLPVAAVLELAAAVVEQLSALARAFLQTTDEALGPPGERDLTDADVAQMAALAERLRPLASLAVARTFPLVMERESVAMFGRQVAALTAAPGRGTH